MSEVFEVDKVREGRSSSPDNPVSFERDCVEVPVFRASLATDKIATVVDGSASYSVYTMITIDSSELDSTVVDVPVGLKNKRFKLAMRSRFKEKVLLLLRSNKPPLTDCELLKYLTECSNAKRFFINSVLELLVYCFGGTEFNNSFHQLYDHPCIWLDVEGANGKLFWDACAGEEIIVKHKGDTRSIDIYLYLYLFSHWYCLSPDEECGIRAYEKPLFDPLYLYRILKVYFRG